MAQREFVNYDGKTVVTNRDDRSWSDSDTHGDRISLDDLLDPTQRNWFEYTDEHDGWWSA